jgi:hypothetical protein
MIKIISDNDLAIIIRIFFSHCFVIQNNFLNKKKKKSTMSHSKQHKADEITKQIHSIRDQIDTIMYSDTKIKNTHFESSWIHYCDDADPDVPYRLNNEMLEEAVK